MRMPEQEELELIRKVVLLPRVISAINRHGAADLDRMKMSLKPLFKQTLGAVRQRVLDDLAFSRRELVRLKIKVTPGRDNSYAIHYFYSTKEGFNAEVGMYEREARKEIGRLLAGYISGMFEHILN